MKSCLLSIRLGRSSLIVLAPGPSLLGYHPSYHASAKCRSGHPNPVVHRHGPRHRNPVVIEFGSESAAQYIMHRKIISSSHPILQGHIWRPSLSSVKILSSPAGLARIKFAGESRLDIILFCPPGPFLSAWAVGHHLFLSACRAAQAHPESIIHRTSNLVIEFAGPPGPPGRSQRPSPSSIGNWQYWSSNSGPSHRPILSSIKIQSERHRT